MIRYCSDMKELVGKEIAKRVQSGQKLGIGTGSTVTAALQQIAKRIRDEGLKLSGLPTSYQSTWLCEEAGIEVLAPSFSGQLDWGFDGADEVDPNKRLIKGQGGAMLKEKLVAARCKSWVVIVDESKLVEKLGSKYPVPLEVVPESVSVVEAKVKEIGGCSSTSRRMSDKGAPVITECGNLILDVSFSQINDSLEDQLNSIPGVVENGLFLTWADEVLIGSKDGVRSL